MKWDEIAGDYLAVAQQVFGPLRDEIEELAQELARRLRKGGKILICGNGGSAADAQHMSGELVNRFLRDRKPYAAIALTTDASVVTSIGNDFGFEQVFLKQVQALGKPGDVLVVFSTSGNAENVCLAVRAAKRGRLLTVGLTGGKGGKLRRMVDRALVLSATGSTPRIQEGHELIMHLL